MEPTNSPSVPLLDLQQRAFNLALAALLGNEVYNFGELVRVFKTLTMPRFLLALHGDAPSI